MIPRFAAVAALAMLPILAVATPNPVADKRGGSGPTKTTTVTVTATVTPTSIPSNACTTGPIQCCDSVQQAGSKSASALLGLLGIVVSDVTALVGLTCSPITVVGIGSGSECSANVVCCENNSFGGLISIGCIPVIL